MQEILPGVWHWTAVHPNIRIEVSSYWLAPERTLLDPLEPPEGLDWFAEHGAPEQVLLTNRHHLRHATRFAERFGCPGMHEFRSGEPVEPFDFGDELPGGIRVHEVGAICPDESALEIPRVRALAVADGVVHYGDELGFVPEQYIGDDPPAIRQALRDAYRGLLDVDFDALLVAHGDPIPSGGKDALRRFAEGAS